MLESREKRKASGDDANGSGEMAMTVGRYLKTEREAQGQDLPQVAEMLRIHRSYLQAIEEGEIEQLPGPTYAVGFVRTYAEHLGLDGNKVAERFFDEAGSLYVVFFDRNGPLDPDERQWLHALPAAPAAVFDNLSLMARNHPELPRNTDDSAFIHILVNERERLFVHMPGDGPQQMDVDMTEPDPESDSASDAS